MFDRKRCGTDIKNKRISLGMSRYQLLARLPADQISKSTLERIEKGSEEVSGSKYYIVMRALEMDPADYMDWETLTVACMMSSEVVKIVDSYRVLFPAGTLYLNYRIRNIADFIIYLPLFPLKDLADLIIHTAGNVVGREAYIFNKLQEMYEKIPASPAKAYADYLWQLNTIYNRKYGTRIHTPFSEYYKDILNDDFDHYLEAINSFCFQLKRTEWYSEADVENSKKKSVKMTGKAAFIKVRFRKGSKKSYWFNVRPSLLEYLRIGCTVTVNTVYGRFHGTAEEIRVANDTQMLTQELGFMPQQDLRCVYTELPLDYIYISRPFIDHPPGEHKIRLRKQEWNDGERFRTRVKIRSDGLLLDGYSAYLAAIQLHLPTIYCKVVPKREPKNDPQLLAGKEGI